MKGMYASILEDKRIGNCSNRGISSWAKEVLLVGPGIPEIFESRPEIPMVKMGERMGRVFVEPVSEKDPDAVGWMFGGAFVWCSDSRFPAEYPIPLMDRQEWGGGFE